MSTGAERPTFIISFQSDGHNLISAWTGCCWSPGKTRRKTAGGVAAVLNFTGNTGSGVCVCCKRAKRGQGPDRTGQIVLYAQNGTRLNCFENGEANGRERELRGLFRGERPLISIINNFVSQNKLSAQLRRDRILLFSRKDMERYRQQFC